MIGCKQAPHFDPHRWKLNFNQIFDEIKKNTDFNNGVTWLLWMVIGWNLLFFALKAKFLIETCFFWFEFDLFCFSLKRLHSIWLDWNNDLFVCRHFLISEITERYSMKICLYMVWMSDLIWFVWFECLQHNCFDFEPKVIPWHRSFDELLAVKW